MPRVETTSKIPPSDARRRLIATVQIARKQLAMDDDAYLAMLARITRQTSCRHCTDAQLQAVVGECKRLGFRPAPGRGARAPSPRAKVRLIHALWADIRPHLDAAGDEALRGFVRRQTASHANPHGVDAPEFIPPRQVDAVIEGLKGWLSKLRQLEAADAR